MLLPLGGLLGAGLAGGALALAGAAAFGIGAKTTTVRELQPALADNSPAAVAKSRAMTPLAFGDSDRVHVGDSVVAIGNPLGYDRSMTAGIVSAVQRAITAPNQFQIDHVIQTDAPINHGNSGGPLINARGEVVGVNAQIATGSGSDGNIGIGFAIPINTV